MEGDVLNPLFRKKHPARPDRKSASELAEIVRAVTADEQLWLPRLELPAAGERWWTRLTGDLAVDVWLLSWAPGHGTELHDHGFSAAAFSVVRGRLTELRQGADGRLRAHRRGAGSVTTIPAGVVHDVHGAGRSPAVSIHAYSPPLREMNFYDLDAGGNLHRTGSVHTTEPERASA
jgi:mannose-6-phosphate isomerase-like protein (cupin superfamily)